MNMPTIRHTTYDIRHTVCAAALSAALLAAAGCGRGEADAVTGTLARYVGAVQEQNLPALWALRAWDKGERSGVTPEPDFEIEANGYFAAYETGKRAGELKFDSWGVALVRALALGRGAYYRVSEISAPRPDARTVLVHVPLPYESLDYAPFPEGTTLYFLEPPLGGVHKHVVGSAPSVKRELLSEVTLRWTLVRDAAEPPLSPTGWLVLAVAVEEGSARFRPMEFRVGG
jgi:hypothetical protein